MKWSQACRPVSSASRTGRAGGAMHALRPLVAAGCSPGGRKKGSVSRATRITYLQARQGALSSRHSRNTTTNKCMLADLPLLACCWYRIRCNACYRCLFGSETTHPSIATDLTQNRAPYQSRTGRFSSGRVGFCRSTDFSVQQDKAPSHHMTGRSIV